MNALAAILTRLDWAEQHLDNLKVAFLASAKEPGNHLAVELEPNRGYVSATTKVSQKEMQWGLWAGDVIHNTRASLDNLVHHLISQRPKEVAAYKSTHPRKNFQQIPHFPVYAHEVDFNGNWKVNALRAILPPEQFAAVKASQPFDRNKAAPKSALLYILQVLNNIDKHRALLVVDQRLSVKATLIDPQWKAYLTSPAMKVKHGTKLFEFTMPSVSPETKVDVESVTLYLTFAEPICGSDGVIDLLRRVVSDTRDIVRTNFGSFLS